MNTPRPIHVSFVIDRLSRAGTESQLLALLQGLDRNKIRPSLVLLDGTDEESQALEPKGVPLIRLGLKRLLGPEAIRASASLVRFWRKDRPDVVQSYFLDSSYFAIPLARLLGIRKVVRVRNNLGYWLSGKHLPLGRLMGRLAHRTLTNSEVGKRALNEIERGNASKIAVIENGVDLERFRECSPVFWENRVLTVGAVANLRPVKNIDGLIRVASQLRHLPLRWEVAGTGPEQNHLLHLIERHQLADRFFLKGALQEIPAFLKGIDIAVLPSHSESMSNALLEYMAAGRAIVATDTGANATLVRHGIEGQIVPPKTDPLLAQAIAFYSKEPLLAHQHAKNAQKRVQERFSRQAMIHRFEEFYQACLKG